MELTNGLTVLGYAIFGMDGVAPQLASITIPSTLTFIGRVLLLMLVILHYNHSSLPHIFISIGDGAFYKCSSLSRVELTNGLTLIGERMFYMFDGATLLSSVTIPSTLTAIGKIIIYIM